jgi:calmodulin
MDEQFTQKELKSFQNAFSLFDKDHDGKLTAKELEGVLRFLGKNISDYNMDGIFKKIDMYGNGTVGFPEFLQLMSQTSYKNAGSGNLKNEEVMAVFRIFDKDGDGFITADEIQKEMGNHGDIFTEEQVQQMMKGADGNGDGKIDYQEFIKVMQANK